jgi:hypothetical protein
MAAPADGAWHLIAAHQSLADAQVGLQRTADGVLHVAWGQGASSAGNDAALFSTPISRAGQVGARSTIASRWISIGDADLLSAPFGGLEVFFNGSHSSSGSDPLNGLLTSFAAASGTVWGAPSVVQNKDYAYLSTGASAVLTSSGTPLETWLNGGTPVVHRGLDPSTPDFAAGGQGTGANLATDLHSGATFLGWYGFRTRGAYWQAVDPSSGAPMGTAHQLSNSADVQPDYTSQRLPMVARPGGGVFVAADGSGSSGSSGELRLWRLGGGSFRLAKASGQAFETAALAAGPDGRLWVAWTRGETSGMFVRDSNQTLTGWSPVHRVPLPSGAIDVAQLDANAQTGRLDLVARFNPPSANQISLQTRQVLPALNFSAQPVRFDHHHRTTINFLVTDAGTPLAGATVSVAGERATTNAGGKASLTLGPYARRKRLAATAAHAGYYSASLTLRAA